ncbi:Cytochrome c oxidase subunit 5B, mitochondrial [Dispira simplex]|nr:Cytochrome c oxidase subunit 5B, mitochondrial [Dispira simplex]
MMYRTCVALRQPLNNAGRALVTRSYATATAAPPAAPSSTSMENSESYLDIAKVPLASVEVAYNNWTDNQKAAMSDRLVELQKQDWKNMSLDEKRAVFFVAFGPHTARTPRSQPGDGWRTLLGVGAALAVSVGSFMYIRSFAQKSPHTMTPEWQEASNEYARQNNLNPITGISSEGYQGKGLVTTK